MSAKKNKPLKIVVVGGVAGGASAAAKARRVDELAEIVLFERGPHVSFANCGLPYHLSGEIEKRDDLFIITQEVLKKRFGLDVRINSEVIEIDRQRKIVVVKQHPGDTTYEESYDKLILAPGTEAMAPQIPGREAGGVFTLKTIEDMDSVIEYINHEKPESAVVVGGGFIGLETAEALHTKGLEVTVVEACAQILLPWDADMADPVDRHMQDSMFIEIYKNDPLAEILRDGDNVTGVKLESGEVVEAELVLLAIGVKPLTELAKTAGLDLGIHGLIVTNPRMQTSDQDIYAAGDAVQTRHRITGLPTWLPMAGPANRQGRTAGANAAGGNMTFPGVIGTCIVRVGKICAARTGLNEKEAIEADLDYLVVLTSGKSHAGYYPGAKELLIKFVVENKTGRLLGGQIVGKDGVDKRIDILATAIIGNMTVADIVNLELAYAPPFGAAKDPINMTAMVAQNILTGVSKAITWEEYYSQDPRPKILDVRSEEERKTVYIQGTDHIPIDEMRERMDELDPKSPITIHCRIGQRGYFAEQMLKGRGFENVQNLAGGWRSIWGELLEDKLLGQEPEEAE
ncbi:MAG: FAD-dependent oxidoreductase [Proteobacteria bacterium]|nr:FAD-dependent oxidoreductase [Pseudomonadota bacterium]